jgi:exodeoxyribonuclease VII large subunit
VLRRARANVEHMGELTMVGEVANFKVHQNGHWIFDLKDKNCGVPCTMWWNDTRRVKFAAENGLEVKVTGTISINPFAKIQVRVTAIEPVGQGALELAFKQLKEKLAGEGLFAAERKKPLPVLPRRVGVVASSTGAALHDVIKVLYGRMPRLHVIVSPTKTQGQEAPALIAEAVRRLDKTGLCDVILLVRGGGAREDLHAFNTEPVARAIFHAKTPIVSGVGHENDVTIADLVADKRAATPSNAAELAVPNVKDLLHRIDAAAKRIRSAAGRDLQRTHRQVDRLSTRLSDALERKKRAERTRVEKLERRMEEAWRRRRRQEGAHLDLLDKRLRGNAPHRVLSLRRERVANAAARLNPAMRAILEEKRRELDALSPRLTPALNEMLAENRRALDKNAMKLLPALKKIVDDRKRQFAVAAAQLNALSPLGVVARGYSVVTRVDDGKLVQTVSDAPPGTQIEIKVSDGKVKAKTE